MPWRPFTLAGMQDIRALLEASGLPPCDPGPPYPQSSITFPGGERFRVEIPEIETPSVFCEMLQAARRLGVPVHRVSQGTGITLLSDSELRQMVRIGAQEGIEVFLFVGARATHDIGAFAYSERGAVVGKRLRGTEGLVHGLADVFRAAEAGIRGILAADEGLILLIDELRRQGKLPADLKTKSSVAIAAVNPVLCRLLERIGVDSLNVATDLTVGMIVAIRQSIRIPIDFYVESPPEYGGFARYHDMPDLVRAASPIYLKFGLKNETRPLGRTPRPGRARPGVRARAAGRPGSGAVTPPRSGVGGGGSRRVHVTASRTATGRACSQPARISRFRRAVRTR